jgi:hypothetical protein
MEDLFAIFVEILQKDKNNLEHMQYSNVGIIKIQRMKNYVYNYLYN